MTFVFIFHILFSSMEARLCLDLRGRRRRSRSRTTTFIDPTKSLNLAAGHSLISDSLAARLIENVLFDHNSLATTGDNPNRRWYGVMSPSIEEFRYDKDHGGKGPSVFKNLINGPFLWCMIAKFHTDADLPLCLVLNILHLIAIQQRTAQPYNVKYSCM